MELVITLVRNRVLILYSSASKLNSTFGTTGKAMADKMTAKVVGKLEVSLKREELI